LTQAIDVMWLKVAMLSESDEETSRHNYCGDAVLCIAYHLRFVDLVASAFRFRPFFTWDSTTVAHRNL